MRAFTGETVKRACQSLQLWYVWIICNSHFFSVQGQCTNGFEVSCIWSHDETSTIRWVSKRDSIGRFVELSNCKFPRCGTGLIQSPWLPAREQEVPMTLQYKIYGTSAVYLRLYLKTTEGKQIPVFSKDGNYAYIFPEEWSSKTFKIPVTTSRHRLLLKAHTPFKEAVVQVRGISLDGTDVIDEEIEDDRSIPNDYSLEDEDREDEELEQFRELDGSDIREEDLSNRYTRVVEPELCKYQ